LVVDIVAVAVAVAVYDDDPDNVYDDDYDGDSRVRCDECSGSAPRDHRSRRRRAR
jgi:hypothetical protein